MRPRRTPSSTGVLTLPGGNEDNDLWIQHGADENENPVMRSVWQPSEEERAAIAAGANVDLRVWGHGHPPVAVGVTTEPLGKGPDARSA